MVESFHPFLGLTHLFSYESGLILLCEVVKNKANKPIFLNPQQCLCAMETCGLVNAGIGAVLEILRENFKLVQVVDVPAPNMTVRQA